ncbi:hypothetical protein CCR75_003047 [Bremia lactucae]|uniref:Uncharacterized protein n=1 Tax=Bremia lactucae TaxID=4779 RepID=A0A976NZU5_BRELC|nr:hypothetical protein CCR75_003047 [Bremia lactucae]
MSISVSRESISKLMGELVESFPIEGDGRSSISDFGKLLFTEGQSNNNAAKIGQLMSSSLKATAATPPASAIHSETMPARTGMKRVFTEIKGVPRQKQHDIMKTKDKAIPKRWTPEEDEKLREAVGRHGERNWKSIAEEVPRRNHTQCLQRWTKVLAPGLVKGHWRPEEDDLLKELVAEGRKNWGQVATRIPGRTSKQCRERWYNHLDPSIIRGEYTPEEDRMILSAQSRLGNRWSAIAAMLPGRTEDAVKIRWKSLCRVRKGHGRRGQSDKGKVTVKGEVMAGQSNQQSANFDSRLVKSEEVAAFSMYPQQQNTPLGRYPNGSMVPASTPHHSSIGGGMSGNGIMYHSDLSSEGYDPAMTHYRKPLTQQPLANNVYQHQLPSSGPIPSIHTQDYGVDRRSNLGHMLSNGLAISSQSQDGYRQEYQGPSPSYPSTMSNSVYASGPSTPSGAMTNGQFYGMGSQLNHYRSIGTMYSDTQMSPHPSTPHFPHPQLMSYDYNLPTASKPIGGVASSSLPMHASTTSNPAAAFVQRPHLTQQFADRHSPVSHRMPHQILHREQPPVLMQQRYPTHEQDQPSPEKEPPQAQSKLSRPFRVQRQEEPRTSQARTPSPRENPAAMFARSQTSKPNPVVANTNPVAAFLQHQARKEQHSASSKMAPARSVKAFNPAAAFAQRFQASQRPPMPSSNSGSTKSNDTAEEDDDGAHGRTTEPSLKKVKPRLSIDIARASAARRLRSSGSNETLAGRGSLDVFLNEIGDVGRLSDLKMDGFQTLEELWRVSGDMDRLSL